MSEHDHQVTVFEWATLNVRTFPHLRLLFAVPNGGGRGKGDAGRLKAEGVQSGVPDIALPVARGQYSALFIEMKDGPRKTSAAQDVWLARLNEAGNYACVCRSAGEAIATLKWYLTGAAGPAPKA